MRDQRGDLRRRLLAALLCTALFALHTTCAAAQAEAAGAKPKGDPAGAAPASKAQPVKDPVSTEPAANQDTSAGAKASDTAAADTAKSAPAAGAKSADKAAVTDAKAVDKPASKTSADTTAKRQDTAPIEKAAPSADAKPAAADKKAEQAKDSDAKGKATGTKDAAATPAVKGKSGEELDKAVEAAEKSQENRAETAGKVVAQEVAEAPAVELASGDGDVSTAGKCRNEIDFFCIEVKPGEGRLAECLSKERAEEDSGKAEGTNKLSEDCKSELDAFKVDRSSNINKNVKLAKACKKDADKLCKDVKGGDGKVLACLRQQKDKLSQKCQKEVFQSQVEGADDFRTDRQLYKACKMDAEKQCKGVKPHRGKVQDCLRGHRMALSWDCQEQLFRQEVENADDIRLSIRLFSKCLADKKKFCKDVEPGNAHAKECLEQHRNDAGFSADCKAEIEAMMEARAADFRLDSQLRSLCKKDIENICGYEKDSLEPTAGFDARVIECLQDYRKEIQSQACQDQVTKTMQLAASDIRFDVPLADACFKDRQTFCSDVPPGSARVIRCLQNMREKLQYDCKATLFDQEVTMAENIDFQFPMKKACAADIPKFCKDVPRGHARVIRCLQENQGNAEFTEECRKEVQKHEQFVAADYRLNYRLKENCKDAIAKYCKGACKATTKEQPCGGGVLRCLTENVDKIEAGKCTKEVLYFQKMEIRDFRNDIILAEACRTDVEKFCSKVKPGEGRVHVCLREHRDKLTVPCRREEVNLSIVEASSMELQPGISRACTQERTTYCAGVKPGQSRLFSCLLVNSAQADYTQQCKASLIAQQHKRLRDWRLDYTLRANCRDQVPKWCQAALTAQDSGQEGAVLSCLIDNQDMLPAPCFNELSRAIHTGLQFYQTGAPVTKVCDADINAKCLAGDAADSAGIGAIRSCLANLLAPGQPLVPDTPLSSPEEPATDEQGGRRRLLADQKKDLEKDQKKEEKKLGEEKKAENANDAQAVKEEVPGTAGGGLSPDCDRLVRLAEPVDAYGAFSSSFGASASALQKAVKQMEAALPVKEGTLVKPAETQDGQDALTLTGWSAVIGIVSILLVSVAGAVWGYRRYMGYDKYSGYTVVKKTRVPMSA